MVHSQLPEGPLDILLDLTTTLTQLEPRTSGPSDNWADTDITVWGRQSEGPS